MKCDLNARLYPRVDDSKEGQDSRTNVDPTRYLARMNDTIIRSIRACSAALEQLAAALETQSVSRPTAATSNSSWPDMMTTSVAARYCGFKTTGALRKARLDGRVTPAGRRGSRGSLTWAKAELDRFMCGRPPPVVVVVSSDEANAKPKMKIPNTPHRPRRATRLSKESEEALRRIKEIARPKKTSDDS